MEWPVSYDTLKAVRLFASSDAARGGIHDYIQVAWRMPDAVVGQSPLYENPFFAATNSYIACVGTANAGTSDTPATVARAYSRTVASSLLATDALDTYFKLAPKGQQLISDYEKHSKLSTTQPDAEFTTITVTGIKDAIVWQSTPGSYAGEYPYPNLRSFYTVENLESGIEWAVDIKNLELMQKAAKAIGAEVVQYHGHRSGKEASVVPHFFSIRNFEVMLVVLVMPVRTTRSWT